MITNTKDKAGEGVFAELKTMLDKILNVVTPKKVDNASNPKCPDCSKPMNEVTSFQCDDCGSKASNAILEKITAAEKVNTDIRNEYATLEAEAITLRQTVADNATTIANHTQAVTDLNTKIAGLEADLTAYNKGNAQGTKPAGTTGKEADGAPVMSKIVAQFKGDIDKVNASLAERSEDAEDISHLLENSDFEGMTEEQIEAIIEAKNKK